MTPKYKLERTCEVCGDPKSGGYDHTECAQVNKAKYAGTNENKNPLKVLSKKQREARALWFSKNYD